jgi:hypothetical protein
MSTEILLSHRAHPWTGHVVGIAVSLPTVEVLGTELPEVLQRTEVVTALDGTTTVHFVGPPCRFGQVRGRFRVARTASFYRKSPMT